MAGEPGSQPIGQPCLVGAPTIGLLTFVAGIQPAAPGFARVRITPHLGMLKQLNAAMAHPAGLIETRYAVRGGRLTATITLPATLSGTFLWQGQAVALHGGRNRLALNTVRAK